MLAWFCPQVSWSGNENRGRDLLLPAKPSMMAMLKVTFYPDSLVLWITDLEKYHETDTEEDQDAFLMENTYLNSKNVAIDENTGEEMSVSNMNASQMKAELEAKGLSTKGLKGDLSRRVQVHSILLCDSLNSLPRHRE